MSSNIGGQNDQWNGNGWSNYQKLVLKELERHNEAIDALDKDIQSLRIDLAMLKVKASVWGLMGGLIPVLITLGLFILERSK